MQYGSDILEMLVLMLNEVPLTQCMWGSELRITSRQEIQWVFCGEKCRSWCIDSEMTLDGYCCES